MQNQSFTLGLITATAIAVSAGAQTFVAVTGQEVVEHAAPSTGSAWVDVDADGDLDLYVANGNLEPAANSLFLRDGDLWTPVTAGGLVTDAAPSIGSAWADVDGDGDLDAFVVNRQGVANTLFRNDGGGSFTALTDAAPSTTGGNSNTASWVDVDADGDLDLFVLTFGGANELYLNDGAGELVEAPESAITAGGFSICAIWGDVDGNGLMDLFIGNGGNRDNQLFLNRGGLEFEAAADDPVVADGGASIGASFGDFDNDLDLDLFVANFLDQKNFLYLNRGDGRFERAFDRAPATVASSSVGSTFSDLDNDGDLDLVVGNDPAADAVFRNTGDGHFVEVSDSEISAAPGHTFSVSAADVDGDGDLDVFTADRLGANRLLLNAGNDNRWLHLDLVGRGSNTAAVGATVVATATIGGVEVRQMRHVVTQSGYNAGDSLTVELGLGDATHVDELVIRWPSGREQALTGVATNRRLVLTEPVLNDSGAERRPAPVNR